MAATKRTIPSDQTELLQAILQELRELNDGVGMILQSDFNPGGVRDGLTEVKQSLDQVASLLERTARDASA